MFHYLDRKRSWIFAFEHALMVSLLLRQHLKAHRVSDNHILQLNQLSKKTGSDSCIKKSAVWTKKIHLFKIFIYFKVIWFSSVCTVQEITRNEVNLDLLVLTYHSVAKNSNKKKKQADGKRHISKYHNQHMPFLSKVLWTSVAVNFYFSVLMHFQQKQDIKEVVVFLCYFFYRSKLIIVWA